MPEWKNNQPINYTYGGETVDSLTQKLIATFNQIFEYLNILRSAGAVAGLDATDAMAYQWRINTTDNSLYMRSGDNETWISLGKVAQNFGITPSVIGAIANGGNIGKISSGLDSSKPTSGNSANDFYYATDTFTLYRWTGSAWAIALSKKFKDILDYEQYCISRDEVAANGKDKIPRLDSVSGKGNFDITGSPERLLGYEIDVQNFKDGDVLVLNTQKNKIVNLPKDDVKSTDLTVSGEAGKVAKIATDGKLHATLQGSASQIDGITVDTTGIKAGQVLMYKDGKLKPADKDVFTEDDVTTTGEPNKLVKTDSDGKLHLTAIGDATLIAGIPVDRTDLEEEQVLIYRDGKWKPAKKDYYTPRDVTSVGEKNKLVQVSRDGNIYGIFNGKTTQIGDVKVSINNLQDGQILTYHKSLGAFKNEAKSAVGAGASLILLDGQKVLGDYNGSSAVMVDIAKIIANSSTYYINHILRLIENLYLTLEVAELNPGGYDGMVNVAFSNDIKQIDQTSVLVTSQIANDNSIDVDDISVIVAGANYRIVEGAYVENVQVKEVKQVSGIKRIILTRPVQHQFTINNARLVRSALTLSNGRLTGTNVMVITKPIAFSAVKSRVHCIVKHQLTGEPKINVAVSLRNSLTEDENFIEMTKCKTYSDDLNAGRGSTEYTFVAGRCTCNCANCTCGAKNSGMIATLRITATGSPVSIDSFSAVFNE